MYNFLIIFDTDIMYLKNGKGVYRTSILSKLSAPQQAIKVYRSANRVA